MQGTVTITLSDYEQFKLYEKAVTERVVVSTLHGLFNEQVEDIWLVDVNEKIQAQSDIINEQRIELDRLRNLKWWQRV